MCLDTFGWQTSTKIREILDDSITDLVDNHKEILCENPLKDFTRNRVFTPRVIINTLLQFEAKNTESELIDIFDCKYQAGNINAALLMQRAKIRDGAFPYLFNTFTDNVLTSGLLTPPQITGYDGGIFLADGTGCNIAMNEKDPQTFIKPNGKKGNSQFHLNALYDFRNKAFVNAVVQGIKKKEERQALIKMITELDPTKKALIIADRGYESYNVFAACIENYKDFIIRIKDIGSNGIMASHAHKLPEGEFDLYISTILIKKKALKTERTKDIYTVLSPNTNFDYFDENGEYAIGFRIVRFLLPNGEYETIATSLDRIKYGIDVIKELYNDRWDCETAFRKLKTSLGLVHFHSRKMKYILQELYIKLILNNLICFVMEVVRSEDDERYGDFYETEESDALKDVTDIEDDIPPESCNTFRIGLAFSQAVTACRKLLKGDWRKNIIDVIETIRAHTYRIKLYRNFVRNVKAQSWSPFNHRTS